MSGVPPFNNAIVFTEYSFSGSLPTFLPTKISTLAGTLDVEILNPQDGQILTYQASTGTWENTNQLSLTASLNDLTDVTINNSASGEILLYLDGKWKNAPHPSLPSINQLNNVNAEDPEQDQYLVYDGELWVNKQQVTDISDLEDYTQSNLLLLGQPLQYTGAFWTNEFLTAKKVEGLAEVATQGGLQNLNEVNIRSPEAGQYLVYDSVTSQWINEALQATLGTFTDVTITNVSEGDLLVYNGTGWTNQPNAGTPTLAGMSDTLISNPVARQVLVYVSGTGVWVNINTAETTPIGDLSDVTITSVANGDYLVYNGTEWVDEPVTLTIDNIDDITLSNLQVGDILFYTGTGWANAPAVLSLARLQNTNISSVLDGDVLLWDGTNWVNVANVDKSIEEIGNVSFVGLSTNEIFGYDGTNWTNIPIVDDLQGVVEVDDSMVPSEGDLLMYDGAEWTSTQVAATSIPELSDVTITNLIASQVLVFDGRRGSSTFGQWVNDFVSTETLNDLIGVSITNPLAGEVLVYNSTMGVWQNQAIPLQSLSDITDVTLNFPVANDMLIYNGTAWVNENVLLSLDQVYEVNTTGSVTGNVLVYNQSTSSFESVPKPGTTLEDLSDVLDTSPVNRNLLGYNGTLWYPYFPVDQDLTAATDVTFTSFSTGDLIVYESGVWKNLSVSSSVVFADIPDVNVTSASTGEALIYSASSNEWVAQNLPAVTIPSMTDVIIQNLVANQYLIYDGTYWRNEIYPVWDLEELTDVTADNPQVNDVLVYSGGSWNSQDWSLALGQLTDVTITNPADGEVLEYNGTIWVNATLAARALADCSDVAFTPPLTSGQYFLYESASSKWVNGDLSPISLNDITNVQITSPTSGQYLGVDNSVANQWVNENPTPFTLSKVSDVILTNVSVGQILKYSGAVWYNTSQQTVSLDDLTDVVIINPLDNQVLSFNGTDWFNITDTVPSLGQFSDVVITTPTATGETLMYDGSVWTNSSSALPTTLSNITGVTITTPQNDQVLVGTANNWSNQTQVAQSIETMMDTRITTPGANQYLLFDGAEWINTSQPEHSLVTTKDVLITSPQDGDIIQWDSTLSKWVNRAQDFPSMVDVNVEGAQNGDVLQFDGTEWKSVSSYAPSLLTGFRDVQIVSTSLNDLLVYDNSTAKWRNRQTVFFGIDDIETVTISNPQSGEFLQYNGTEWVNTSPNLKFTGLLDVNGIAQNTYVAAYNGTSWQTRPQVVSVGDCSDVFLSAESTGQTLVYDANTLRWENAAVPNVTLSSILNTNFTALATGEILGYNGTEWVNVSASSSSINDLSDVNISNPQNNEVLRVNGSGIWENKSTSFQELFNVENTPPVRNDTLLYNVAAAEYKSVEVGRTSQVSSVIQITSETGNSSNNPTFGNVTASITANPNTDASVSIQYKFLQTTAGDSGGGRYLIKLPTGYEFDSNVHNFVTGNPAQTASVETEMFGNSLTAGCGDNVVFVSSGLYSASELCLVVPYDSKHFRLYLQFDTYVNQNGTKPGRGAVQVWNAAKGFSDANVGFSLNFQFANKI